MEVGGAAAKFNGSLENDHGSRAVNVVIAVDQDLLVVRDGTAKSAGGGGHTEQGGRRVQVIERRVEKFVSVFSGGDIACDEKPCDGGGKVQLRGEPCGYLFIRS